MLRQADVGDSGRKISKPNPHFFIYSTRLSASAPAENQHSPLTFVVAECEKERRCHAHHFCVDRRHEADKVGAERVTLFRALAVVVAAREDLQKTVKGRVV